MENNVVNYFSHKQVDDLIDKIQDSINQLTKIINYASDKGIIPICEISMMYMTPIVYDPRIYKDYNTFIRNANPLDIYIQITEHINPDGRFRLIPTINTEMVKNGACCYIDCKHEVGYSKGKKEEGELPDLMIEKIKCDHMIGYMKIVDIIYNLVQRGINDYLIRIVNKTKN